MTVESLAMNTVELEANQVDTVTYFFQTACSIFPQVLMMDKTGIPRYFQHLNFKDKDLTMFTLTKLSLTKDRKTNTVSMALQLKRKVATELLTTFLPTILLLLITYTTTFFERDMFGDALAVNLTIMLVMTTIFTSKIEELPPTSDTKMIDIWLIFCLLVPFSEVVLSTAIEFLACSCQYCSRNCSIEENADEVKNDDKTKVDAKKRETKAHMLTRARTSQQVSTLSLAVRKNITVFVICISYYQALRIKMSVYCC